MLLDHSIPKQATLSGYDLHRLVQGLTDGETPLFKDQGDSILIRTSKEITQSGIPTRQVVDGDIVAFELRASVSKKTKGRRSYFPTKDWRSRHAWLERQGERHGFHPLTIHCRSTQAKIEDGKGRSFTVDQTDFIGVLKVNDSAKFKNAIANGVGSTAKAFGFGMLIV